MDSSHLNPSDGYYGLASPETPNFPEISDEELMGVKMDFDEIRDMVLDKMMIHLPADMGRSTVQQPLEKELDAEALDEYVEILTERKKVLETQKGRGKIKKLLRSEDVKKAA